MEPLKGHGFSSAINRRVADAAALPKAGVKAKPQRPTRLLLPRHKLAPTQDVSVLEQL
jgi:hypothetical protein